MNDTLLGAYFEFVALQNEKNRAVLNFARFDSLICIVARSWEKSRSLSLVPFLARCRSLSLSLPGLMRSQKRKRPILSARWPQIVNNHAVAATPPVSRLIRRCLDGSDKQPIRPR